MNRCARHAMRVLGALAVATLASCATTEPSAPMGPAMTAEEARAFITRLIPENVTDRAGWSIDIYAAMASLRIAPTADNVCAIVAITVQESGFRVDPPVPGLASIAAKEIERHRERAGIPRMALDTALSLSSSNGKTYAERLRTVTTEAELSQVFDDLIGRVPLGRTFFADRNPVRTGGPMQVSVAYAQSHIAAKAYPYPINKSVRDEVFSRRGGMYFGIAHLLDYPASYDKALYRFADFNAGHYASRNAAFQQAATQASGIPLALDGDLLRYDDGRPARDAGNTEQALRALAPSLGMSQTDIHADLELEKDLRFERTRLYARVFDLAGRRTGRDWPIAVLPRIALKSPKITRNLTTDWFASRVDQRHKRCLARATSTATRASPSSLY